ncbi:MAG: molybdopterin-guanine dinucleotide biosynthesis protein B [Acidocella sp.]|nr:molybdopterin-guanine dinucleotide biosynthesis protein B [Acidocella sp.]
MRAIGVIGWSGSGKTTLVTALIAHFRLVGVSVSTVKHAHHTLTFDTPGKDSFRHAQAGAEEVLLASRNGFALFSAAGEDRLDALLARLAPVDLVIVEGFKSYDMPKLEVYRPALGQPPLWPEMAVAAVVSDAALPGCPVPVLDISAVATVADFIIRLVGVDQPDRASC